MRGRFMTCAAFVLAFCAAVRADFQITATCTADTIDPGHDVIEFFAKNDGANGTGSKVIASDVTVTGVSVPLLIKFTNSAANARADLTGSAAPRDADGNVIPDRSFVNILANDGNDDPLAYSVVETVPANTHALYTPPVTQFEVVGAQLAGGVNATTSNGGRGALIAVAVVPTGQSATISGFLGGDNNFAVPISFLLPVGGPLPCTPEPAALGLLASTMLAVRPRRRFP